MSKYDGDFDGFVVHYFLDPGPWNDVICCFIRVVIVSIEHSFGQTSDMVSV